MIKAVLFTFTFIFGLIHSTYSSPVVPEDFRVSSRSEQIRFQIEKNFSFKSTPSKQELYQIIQRAMIEANPKKVGLGPDESAYLSRQVVHVSQCYGIDPVIFAALIWRESNFKPKSVSERGAVGLTQMTQTGVQEVLERLNEKSYRRLNHLRVLVRRCNPQFFDRLPTEISADTLAAWKNSVALVHLDALVMGALLLKINLATAPHRHDQVGIYRSALEKYNGDPKVKAKFAVDVFQLSKRMTDFPEIASIESKFLTSIQGF